MSISGDRRGQIQLSFSMIFSIIIIIATVGLAFYLIGTFLSSSSCGQVKLFTTNVQEEIDAAWRAPIVRQKYTSDIADGIERVCFGDLNTITEGEKISERGLSYYDPAYQMYLDPPAAACEGNAARATLEHVVIDKAFCAKVIDGEVTFSIVKASSSESLVHIGP